MKTAQTRATYAVDAKANRVSRAGAYWGLIKGRQTLLLLATGVTGWLSAGPSIGAFTAGPAAARMLTNALLLTISLLAAISGATALNMVLDRDIDARMTRTANRPVPTGLISPAQATLFGGGLVSLGLGLGLVMDATYGGMLAVGVVSDLLLYTVWLKRRSPWAILVGGIPAGMPILAGRALGMGRVDAVGLLLALSILLWIPAHMMTLAIQYTTDYQQGGIPTWPTVHGFHSARQLTACASALRTVALVTVGWYLRIPAYGLGLLALSGAVMLGLSLWYVWRPSPRRNHLLFKFASVDMLGSVIILTLGSILSG